MNDIEPAMWDLVEACENSACDKLVPAIGEAIERIRDLAAMRDESLADSWRRQADSLRDTVRRS